MEINNRRSFLQKMGLLTVFSGFNGILPEKAMAAKQATAAKEGGIIASASHAVVNTQYGKVRGYSRNGIYTYKGIPYGATTAGAGRFKPPAAPLPWTDTRDCLVYGPICPQQANTGWLMEEYGFLYQWVDGFQSEDCLRLNIWTPGINDGKKRPVLVWLHGGGFFSGSSQEHPSYDGEALSRLGDVVVVSINHRLNIFGFLELSDFDSSYAGSGNAGMLDIVASLQWIKDNVTQFGGDKENVTVFGQSGGGTKVITLMAMPAAKGLFHKAISQSNSIVQVATHAYATHLAGHVLDHLQISHNNIAALNDIPVPQLVAAYKAAEKKMGGAVPPDVGRSGFQPVVDGAVLPFHPFDPGAPAISAGVPFMVGSNRNEASASINNAVMENITEDRLQAILTEKFPAKGKHLYEVMRKVHPQVKPVEILSFVSAQNPMAYLMASRKAAQQAAPAYLYMFCYQTPVLDARPRAFHCSEIPFVFNNTQRCETMTGGGDKAAALAGKMAAAWISFARSGRPGHAGLPSWPAFENGKGQTMLFNHTCAVVNDPDGEARHSLERIYYNKEK